MGPWGSRHLRSGGKEGGKSKRPEWKNGADWRREEQEGREERQGGLSENEKKRKGGQVQDGVK